MALPLPLSITGGSYVRCACLAICLAQLINEPTPMGPACACKEISLHRNEQLRKGKRRLAIRTQKRQCRFPIEIQTRYVQIIEVVEMRPLGDKLIDDVIVVSSDEYAFCAKILSNRSELYLPHVHTRKYRLSETSMTYVK